MKRKWVILLIIVVIILAAVGYYYFLGEDTSLSLAPEIAKVCFYNWQCPEGQICNEEHKCQLKSVEAFEPY